MARKRKLAAVLGALLLLHGAVLFISPNARSTLVSAFDEVHYRAWKLGGDHGVNVPMLERTKFDFLGRLIQDTVVPETNRWIDEKTGREYVAEPEASGAP